MRDPLIFLNTQKRSLLINCKFIYVGYWCHPDTFFYNFMLRNVFWIGYFFLCLFFQVCYFKCFFFGFIFQTNIDVFCKMSALLHSQVRRLIPSKDFLLLCFYTSMKANNISTYMTTFNFHQQGPKLQLSQSEARNHIRKFCVSINLNILGIDLGS